MADYVSILGRAIDGLSQNTPSNREQVYQKARAAIDRKLRAIEPALSEDAISSQLTALETAIGEVEASHAIGVAAAEPALPETVAEKAAPEPMPAPVAHTPPASEPVVSNDAPITAPEEPKAESPGKMSAEPRVEPSVQTPVEPSIGTTPEVSTDVAPDPNVGEVPPAPEVPAPDIEIASPAAPVAPAIETPVVEPAETGTIPPFISELDDDPTVAASTGRTDKPMEAAPAAPAQRPLAGSDAPLPPLRPSTPRPEEFRSGQNVTMPARKGSAGKVIGIVALLAILGGGAAGAYVYRDEVSKVGSQLVGVVEGLLGTTDEKAPKKPKTEAKTEGDPAQGEDVKTAENQTGKDTSRLDSSGESTVGEPIDITPEPPVTQPVVETPVATEQAPATVEVAEPSAEQGTTTGEATTSEETVVAENTGETPASETPQVAVLTGETAYLYEEAVGATGANRDEGSMSWSLANESPEPGSPAEPVIKGMLEVPGRGLALNLTIRRNVDAALPASHVIELLFVALPEFSGGNIDQLSRFVMKNSEQGRGESLVGVPARIDTGFFLIALNNLDQAVQTNLNLLANSSWVDIPVTYVTGRRGLITFAKGETGAAIFKQALDDWKNR